MKLFSREDAKDILEAAKKELQTSRYPIIYISIDEAKSFMDCVDIQAVLREVNKEMNLGLITLFTFGFGIYDTKYVFLFSDLLSR